MSTLQQTSASGAAEIDQALDVAASAALDRGATRASVMDWKRQMRAELGARFFEQIPEG